MNILLKNLAYRVIAPVLANSRCRGSKKDCERYVAQ